MSASSGDRGGVAVKQPDGDWSVAPATPLIDAPDEDRESVYAMSPIPEDVAPNTPLEDPPDVPQPQNVMSSIPEEVEFIEDDADPDKAAWRKIKQIDKEALGVSSFLISTKDEKMLDEEGAPAVAELLNMGQGALNNMALQMGIRNDVLQEWMVDEELHDLKDLVALIIRAQIVVLMKSPPTPESTCDWKDVCKRYRMGAIARPEQPDPRNAIVIVNQKHNMAKQIISILMEDDEPDVIEETFLGRTLTSDMLSADSKEATSSSLYIVENCMQS